jgi:hypothetical protein
MYVLITTKGLFHTPGNAYGPFKDLFELRKWADENVGSEYYFMPLGSP